MEVKKKRGRPKKIVEPKVELPFKATLETNNTIYKSEGISMYEAISNFPLTHTQVKTKGVMTITKGEQKTEKLFYLRPLRMLFASKLRRYGFARQLEGLLKGNALITK